MARNLLLLIVCYCVILCVLGSLSLSLFTQFPETAPVTDRTRLLQTKAPHTKVDYQHHSLSFSSLPLCSNFFDMQRVTRNLFGTCQTRGVLELYGALSLSGKTNKYPEIRPLNSCTEAAAARQAGGVTPSARQGGVVVAVGRATRSDRRAPATTPSRGISRPRCVCVSVHGGVGVYVSIYMCVCCV